MGVGVGVGTPLALIALVITLTAAIFKLNSSKNTLQRKLTERGYVNEVVLEVYCHFYYIQCRLVEYELRKGQSDLVHNVNYQSKLYNFVCILHVWNLMVIYISGIGTTGTGIPPLFSARGLVTPRSIPSVRLYALARSKR